MATTTVETTKTLVQYSTDAGVAVITMTDPPANTYTYEMNRQMDECIHARAQDALVHLPVHLIGVGIRWRIRHGDHRHAGIGAVLDQCFCCLDRCCSHCRSFFLAAPA